MTTIPVKDATGATVDVELPLSPGRVAATISRPVVLSNEDLAQLQLIVSTLTAGILSTVARGAAVSSINPLDVGGRANSSSPTPVSAGQLIDFWTSLYGAQAIFRTDLAGNIIDDPAYFVSGAITSAMTGTTSTSLIAAPAASLRNYITQITVSNSHATVGTDVIIQDGSGGTTLYTIPAATLYGGPGIVTFPTPLRQPTTATAIYCANVTTGASTKVSASGYKGL